jgi:S1-C subfamily serine protease
VVDLGVLYRQLEGATFTQREQIADEVARSTSPDELGPLVRGLDHPQPRVRLGVIEILRRANFRPALRPLLEHARRFDGDDQVFALRALAQLARPGDDFLSAAVQGWLRSSDPFIAAHAAKLAGVLAGRDPAARPARPPSAPPVRPPSAPARPPSAPSARPSSAPARHDASEPGASESLDKLMVRLFDAATGPERIALVEAIERRGIKALVAAAKLTLRKGNADLVAYMCRALIRAAAALPAPEGLPPLLEAARARLGGAPIANAAIDDALLALAGVALSPRLMSRLAELDDAQVDLLVERLAAHPAGEVALHVPAMLPALAARPALWSRIGPALARAAPHVRESARVDLRRLTELVVDDLRQGKILSPVTVTSACRVLARIAEPGEALSAQLRAALERLASADAVGALCALCARLATEEAALVLLAMLRDPQVDARLAAREALAAWRSPWILLEGTEEPAIVHVYKDEKGQPLARRGDRLVVATSGDEYALDWRGRPVRAGETELGGCLCCSPPRALVRRRGHGVRCPASWESHLRDGGRSIFEKDHALGRCRRCDSARPRIRDGSRVICIDCGAGIASEERVGPAPESPVVPSEHGRDPDALPKPPTGDELEHVAPAIRAAIMANVFLHARDRDRQWNGSGIIIARDGAHVAILTNRHVVESDDKRLCVMKAMTVSGETLHASAVWRATRGVDLAILEGRLARPDAVGVMEVGSGEVLVGDEVFAIGNPLGLAWSYTAGTLSAIRHWTTGDGQSLRILQTDANIAPGSSGGGLFHDDGHLLGIMSFLRQGYTGGSAHFAISVAAIREAFERDSVRWRGTELAELRP